MSENFLFKIFCCRFRFVLGESSNQFGQLHARQLAIASHSVLQHQRISCKAPAFTSRPRLCGEGAEQHFKIHMFYSRGVTATAPRTFERKRISHKKHTNKNQKLISHRSESDVCEIVLLIFFGSVCGFQLLVQLFEAAWGGQALAISVD